MTDRERLTEPEMMAITAALELWKETLSKQTNDEPNRRKLAAAEAAAAKVWKTYVEGGRVVCETGEDSR